MGHTTHNQERGALWEEKMNEATVCILVLFVCVFFIVYFSLKRKP